MDRRVFIYSVVSSIVATILFVWFLEPALRAAWGLLSDGSSWLSTSIENRAFASAARGQRDWVSVLLLMMFVNLGGGLIVGLEVATLVLRRVRDRKESSFGFQPIAKVARKLRLWTLPVFLFGMFMLIFTPFVDLQLTTSFNQRLAALGPYISDETEEELRSKWALMNTRADFETINELLQREADAAKIELPELLYR